MVQTISPSRPVRRRVGLAVAVVLILAAVIVGRSVSAYAPLEAGSFAQLPPESREGATDDAFPSDPPPYNVQYSHGASTTLTFSVRNGGRWGITIVDLPILHQSAYVLLDFTEATTADPNLPDRPPQRFEPFSLAPGKERLITLTGTFKDCQWYQPGGGNGFDSMEVAYRFLWTTDRIRLALPFNLEVVSPPQAECPVPPQYQTS